MLRCVTTRSRAALAPHGACGCVSMGALGIGSGYREWGVGSGKRSREGLLDKHIILITI